MTPVDPRAVEAAARAEYEHTESDTWEQAHPQDRADWLESARVALEAAQGIMWAQALREATEEIHSDLSCGEYDTDWFHARNFDRSMLHRRADELDPQ